MSPPKKSSRLLDASDAHQLEEECNCELTPKHENAEHDWCCQICGGNHTERLCPENNTQCAKMDECSNKIQKLLVELTISSAIYLDTTNNDSLTSHPKALYHVNIEGRKKLIIFERLIGFSIPNKKIKLENLLTSFKRKMGD